MKTAEEIAQWVIDNRYPKSEKEKISDHEMYHMIVDSIKPVNVDLADIGTSFLNIKAIIDKGENAERAFFNWFKENGIYWGQRGSNLENILVYETDIETIKDYWDELN